MLLGTDIHRNEPVELSLHDLHSGMHVIGAKQHGKSTLLEHVIAEVMQSGEGLCLLDPHGDLVKAVAGLIPEHRLADVMLLNPMDDAFPFGLNLYECKDPHDAKAVKRTVTRIMHLFNKVFGVSRDTPVMAQFLRQCAYTIIANHMTMIEIPLLLTNRTARAKMLQNVTDPYIRLFWRRYDELSPHDKEFKNDSTINKIDEFATDSITRNLVGQKNTTISMNEIMDTNKIVLVSLPGYDDDLTSLLGAIIVAEIMMVALARADQEKSERKPFHLFADEFGRFNTPDFAKIISETEKYNIIPYVAYQNRIQLDELNKSSTLQIRNFVCYRLISVDAEELASESDCTPPPATKPDPVIPRNVLYYLPKHPDEHVRTFHGTYIAKMAQAARLNIEKESYEGVYEYIKPEYDFGGGEVTFNPQKLADLLLQIETFLYTSMEKKAIDEKSRKNIIRRMGHYLCFQDSLDTIYLQLECERLITIRDRNKTLYADDEAFLAFYVAELNERPGVKQITVEEEKELFIKFAEGNQKYGSYTTPEHWLAYYRQYACNNPSFYNTTLSSDELASLPADELLAIFAASPQSCFYQMTRDQIWKDFENDAEWKRQTGHETTYEQVLNAHRKNRLREPEEIDQDIQALTREIHEPVDKEVAGWNKCYLPQIEKVTKELDHNTPLYESEEALLEYLVTDSNWRYPATHYTVESYKAFLKERTARTNKENTAVTPALVIEQSRQQYMKLGKPIHPGNGTSIPIERIPLLTDDEFLQATTRYEPSLAWLGVKTQARDNKSNMENFGTYEKSLAYERSSRLTPPDELLAKKKELENKLKQRIEEVTSAHNQKLRQERHRYDRFTSTFDTAIQALIASPIEVYSTEWSNAPVVQQTFTDRKNEIANSLAHLAPFHARVRLPSGEYTLKMLPPRTGLEGKALEDRITQLREATIAKYCRPRKAVEEEIRKRHLDLFREEGQEEDRQEVRPDTPDVPKNPPRRPRSEKLA